MKRKRARMAMKRKRRYLLFGRAKPREKVESKGEEEVRG